MTYYPGNYEEFQSYLHKRTSQPNNSEKEDRMLALQLKLAQLMAGEEPEGADDRKAFYVHIYKLKEELDKLRADS